MNNEALAKFFPLSFVGNVDQSSLYVPSNSAESLPNPLRNTKPMTLEAKDSLVVEADNYRSLINIAGQGATMDSFKSAGMSSPNLNGARFAFSVAHKQPETRLQRANTQLTIVSTSRTTGKTDLDRMLNDLTFIQKASYYQLETVFTQEFRQSKAFKEMVLVMNQNMVEY
jgi:hypothetical protein